MPDPGYAGSEPPGPLSLLLGTVVVIILFLILKSCMWGG
jgi:hypothetical protein